MVVLIEMAYKFQLLYKTDLKIGYSLFEVNHFKIGHFIYEPL